jgi:hypothetical protein
MIYTLENHELKHAVEEMLFHLLPTETLSRADTAEDALRRMQDIVETEKHRVAPNCATCTMRCGNTDNYDLARLWNAPEELRTLKLRLLAALFTLAQRRSTDRIRKEICDDLFVLAEDWDSSLLSPIVRRAEEL